MPTWPARLHLGSPAPSNPPSGLRGKAPRSPTSHNQQIDNVPLLDVPVLASTDSVVPPLRHKPRHGRSHSNPFTSIFGNGKKLEQVVDAETQDDVVNVFDRRAALSPGVLTKDNMNPANGSPTQSGGKDLVTGKCSTCDHSMSWPKNVDSFRCQVCLMINDLRLWISPAGESLIQETPNKIARNYPYLSLERTRSLIDECLNSYLQLCLDSTVDNAAEHSSIGDDIETRQRRLLSPVTPLNTDVANVQGSISDMPSPSRAPPPPPRPLSSPKPTANVSYDVHQWVQDPSRSIFRPLENYIIACFTSIECLNTSFSTYRSSQLHRAASESAAMEAFIPPKSGDYITAENPFPELDAKTLLLGDFAENGMWWMGKGQSERQRAQDNLPRGLESNVEERVTLRTPRINWADVNDWYRLIVSVGRLWRDRLLELQQKLSSTDQAATSSIPSSEILRVAESGIAEACAHMQRTLLKATENILRRPGRPLRRADDCRFLLILLANPLLYTSEFNCITTSSSLSYTRFTSHVDQSPHLSSSAPSYRAPASHRRSPSNRSGTVGKHSGILKRILGLMANLPIETHHYLISWFSRFSEPHFRRLVEIVGSFVTYRLSRQHGRKRANSHDPHGGLIPSISGPGAGTSAQLHAALGMSGSLKSTERDDGPVSYHEDWQIKASAKVMSLLFSANIQASSRTQDLSKSTSPPEAGRIRAGSAARNGPSRHRQILPTSAFYNTLLDHSNLVADFETWESRRGKFSFCQYPMFLSIWAKIRLMEHDVRRQMEIKAREAFFQSIKSRKAVSQYLVLKVRRDCLVEDSLRSVSEVVGAGQDEIKKGLRIGFVDEEGLDSGGLRKEWFLLLVREVFDPEHGLFVYDEESQYCYFNPNSFETSDQFFLVGVVLGLAIYNSTILDVALPPFAFRKLLASAPNYTGPATSSVRSTHSHTIEDLAEFRPSLAKGLKQMLDFDGNVEETFCRDFVAVVERYDHLDLVPLCSNGENRPVTNGNRHEFVDLYIKYVLDTSVARQYEPFKRGFFSVCEGNALSLFRPEEIELLIRGSDEPLDVATLQAVAIYDGWGTDEEPTDEPVIIWFWEFFSKAGAKEQRKILSFITSSDRIPAMGAMFLTIKVTCLGDHCKRFPIARTCFNMLGLYRYHSREILEEKLWRAVIESEGFGLK